LVFTRYRLVVARQKFTARSLVYWASARKSEERGHLEELGVDEIIKIYLSKRS
jgi:hypothetical protein